jgi:hypothetical protein
MAIRKPTHIETVEKETYRVRGEDKIYDDMVDANKRALKLGRGIEVERMSDKKVVSITPTNVPSPPKFHRQ